MAYFQVTCDLQDIFSKVAEFIESTGYWEERSSWPERMKVYRSTGENEDMNIEWIFVDNLRGWTSYACLSIALCQGYTPSENPGEYGSFDYISQGYLPSDVTNFCAYNDWDRKVYYKQSSPAPVLATERVDLTVVVTKDNVTVHWKPFFNHNAQLTGGFHIGKFTPLNVNDKKAIIMLFLSAKRNQSDKLCAANHGQVYVWDDYRTSTTGAPTIGFTTLIGVNAPSYISESIVNSDMFGYSSCIDADIYLPMFDFVIPGYNQTSIYGIRGYVDGIKTPVADLIGSLTPGDIVTDRDNRRWMYCKNMSPSDISFCYYVSHNYFIELK